MKKPYYDNSNLCAECTGAGCKQCYDTRGLLRLGTERFPLFDSAMPPNIQEAAGKYSRRPVITQFVVTHPSPMPQTRPFDYKGFTFSVKAFINNAR